MQSAETPRSGSETPGTGYLARSQGQQLKRKRSVSSAHKSREYGLMRDTGKHDTARFVGSGSGIHFIRSVYVRLAQKSTTRNPLDQATNDLVPGEDDQLHQGSTSRGGNAQPLWRSQEIMADTAADAPLPAFEDLVEWSASYFETWHSALPFLHAPDVLRTFEDVSKSGINSISPADRLIVRSVMSISLADSRQGGAVHPHIPANLVFSSIDDALSGVQFAFFQPASIRATQAALCVQLFLMSMLRLNSASRLGGLIVRMAFHLGLHRCPVRFPLFTPNEAQIRRRVFWSIYCAERFICQSLGLPLDIHDDDIDVCYPGEELHDTPHATTNAPDPDDSRLQMLKFLSKHARIRGLILELRNKTANFRHDTNERAEMVQAELAKWGNEIHDTVENEAGDYAEEPNNAGDVGSDSLTTPGNRVLLLLLKYESVISLNRPLMASGTDSTSYATALQNCIAAARSIITTMRRHQVAYSSAEIQGGTRFLVPLVWPSFTWAIWISTFILVYAAFEQQLPTATVLRYTEQGRQVLKHIATRDTTWPEYCISAVDELESALREQTKLNNSLGLNTSTQSTNQAVMPKYHQRAVSSKGRPVDPLSAIDDPSIGPVSPQSSISRPRTTQSQDEGAFSPTVSASTGMGEDHLPRRQPPIDNASSAVWSSPNILELMPSHTATRAGDWQQGHRPELSMERLEEQQDYEPESLSNHLEPPSFPGASTFTQAPSLMPQNRLDEQQEPLVWYEQLFGDEFSAIDFPFLAATQLDPFMDPMWAFMR